jgi:hypothetical protein
MKYQFCPTCDKKLGIPEKRWASPVTCPQCNKVFLPAPQYEVSTRRDETPAKPPAAPAKSSGPVSQQPQMAQPSQTAPQSSSKRPSKPSARSLPLPAALRKKQQTSDSLPSTTSAPVPETVPAPVARATPPASAAPPPAVSLPAAQTIAPSPDTSPPLARPAAQPIAPTAQPVAPTAQPIAPKSQPVPPKTSQPALLSATPESRPANAPAERAVAKIIRTHDVEVPLARDGKLPTLHLKDETKAESKTNEIKTSPILLGALICFSLIFSALILLLGDFQSNPDRQSAEKARQSIQNFYNVHEDRPMKPYQLELREAQLAHSKGDRAGEIAAYRNVMSRFRAEDRNQFVGLTGSPTADIELQELISILLRDAKKR